MKRSAALAPLSRDHQHALDVALRLRRATPDGLDAAVAAFEAFWREEGEHHFAVEEQVLLPALPEDDHAWRSACDRLLAEHADLRSRAPALSRGAAPDRLAAAHVVGERLHDHVRFEERELFVLLEERLGEDELARIGAAIEAAGHR